jgi:hypothetical protein
MYVLVNINPRSIVDKMYLPTYFKASRCPGLGGCIHVARREYIVAKSGWV